jgi:DNA-binding beta-propeller fold protein YncE
VATPAAGTIWRIDPTTGSVVASLPVGGQPTVVAAERGAVWAGLATGSLVWIDPKTDRVVQVISAGGPVSGLTISGDKVVATIS